MDTKEVAAILQVSESWVKRLACKLGVGRNNGHGWWFTEDDLDVLMARPRRSEANIGEQVRARKLARQSHCPRCEILTEDGGLCEECQYELATGHFRGIDIGTGEMI